jgi:MoxR-like ATPase
VERAVVGKRAVLEKIMAAMLTSGGHVLLEDYPGLAKTLIANSFASALGLTFKRIQFTPDLLPGDITGGYIYDRITNQFRCGAVRCLPTSSWRMRSTALRPAPSRRCWRPCRSTR